MNDTLPISFIAIFSFRNIFSHLRSCSGISATVNIYTTWKVIKVLNLNNRCHIGGAGKSLSLYVCGVTHTGARARARVSTSANH